MMRGGRVMGCCEGEGGRVVMGTVREGKGGDGGCGGEEEGW